MASGSNRFTARNSMFPIPGFRGVQAVPPHGGECGGHDATLEVWSSALVDGWRRRWCGGACAGQDIRSEHADLRIDWLISSLSWKDGCCVPSTETVVIGFKERSEVEKSCDGCLLFRPALAVTFCQPLRLENRTGRSRAKISTLCYPLESRLFSAYVGVENDREICVAERKSLPSGESSFLMSIGADR